MIKKIAVIFLLVLLCSVSFPSAEEAVKKYPSYATERFFIDCDNAFKLKEFSALRDFFNKHSDKPKPDQCFRLNNSEFLVIITDTGRVGQGLYFVNVKEDKMRMDESGYALMGVDREFLGKNKKRYVLLHMSNLGGGYYSYGYSILNLIPRTNEKPYTIYSLFYVSEDPVAGLCGEKRERFTKEGKNAESIKSYKVLNEGMENVTLIFYIVQEDCKTREKKTYSKKFKLIDGVFKLAN